MTSWLLFFAVGVRWAAGRLTFGVNNWAVGVIYGALRLGHTNHRAFGLGLVA